MPPNVVSGATMMCSFGMAPSTFNATPGMTMIEGRPAGTITDVAPGMNIPPFGMCMSLANPTVASATAAALGVLTPMPCVPVPAGTWLPPSPTSLINKKPALKMGCQLMCSWGGVIQIINPGAMKTLTN